MKRVVACLALAAAAAPAASLAQRPQRETLSLREAVRPVAVAPGGEVILRGAVRSSHDGSVIDAVTTRPGAAGVEGEGAPVPGGLYDVEGGGWRLVAREPDAHAYRLAATGAPGSACAEAGVASPCLPLRLLPLAQSRLLAVADFARTVSGEVTMEVLDPDDAAPAVPPFLERHAVKLGSGAATLAFAYALARALRRRASSPEGQLRRTAARVRRRLAAGDPVHRQLAPSVDALVAHAGELAALRDRLAARVAKADREGLARRREELAAKEASGVAEAARARALVDEQVERVDRWRRESERAGARVAEVHEYLRALDQRLDEAIGAAASAREGATREALAALETDVQAALEGAREADRVVG